MRVSGSSDSRPLGLKKRNHAFACGFVCVCLCVCTYKRKCKCNISIDVKYVRSWTCQWDFLKVVKGWRRHMRLHPTKFLTWWHDVGYHQGRREAWRRPCTNIQCSLSGQWQLAKPGPAHQCVLLLNDYCDLPWECVWWESARPAAISRLVSYWWWTHKFGIERICTSCRHSFYLSGVLVVFLHEGCTPTSQFDKQFWASVMACLNKTCPFWTWQEHRKWLAMIDIYIWHVIFTITVL